MLKYIALITMLLDHINKILYNNEYFILDFFGRLAFPLFIYLSVKSYIFYTSSKEKYILRIFIFAIISIPFYYYAFDKFIPLNIFFTIFLGLLTLYLIERNLFIYTWIPFVFSIYVEYSFFAILCFVAFYNFFKNKNILNFIILFVSVFLLNPYYYYPYLFLLFSIILLDLFFEINFKSYFNKYVFYIFYPLHIFILGILK